MSINVTTLKTKVADVEMTSVWLKASLTLPENFKIQ